MGPELKVVQHATNGVGNGHAAPTRKPIGITPERAGFAGSPLKQSERMY